MDSELLKRVPSNQILVLDTETTGLDDEAEILQFSAIWGTGSVAMNIYICKALGRSHGGKSYNAGNGGWLSADEGCKAENRGTYGKGKGYSRV